MAEQDSDILEVLIRQIGENAEVNPILGKALRVLGHAEFFKPLRNLRQCGTPPTHFAVLAGKDIRRTLRRELTAAPRSTVRKRGSSI